MTFIEKLKEKAEIIARNVAESQLMERIGILPAPTEIATERITLCNSCDSLYKPTNQCKHCGCFVVAKVQFAASSCPINKWPAFKITLSED